MKPRPPTVVALDVAYGEVGGREVGVVAAGAFEGWQAEAISEERTEIISPLRPYVPGRFFERELPCLMVGLEALQCRPDVVVVDGFAWLDTEGRAGLGAALHEALGAEAPVVGVAKNPFRGSGAAEVLRGHSERPLYVTAAGMELMDAVAAVRTMHGPHRLPTMLRRVDRLGREQLEALRRR